MNPATFKTLCEAVGLEQETIAETLDVNVRTVQRWWSKLPPNPAAQTLLLDTIDAYDTFLDEQMEALDAQPEGSTAVLTVYKNQASFERATGGRGLPWRVYEKAIQQLALYAHLDGRVFTVEFVFTEA